MGSSTIGNLLAIKILIHFTLLALIMSAPTFAQNDPHSEAHVNLALGQQAANQALSNYTTHSSNQPLWQDAISYGTKAYELAPHDPEVLSFLASTYEVVGWHSHAWNIWMFYIRVISSLDLATQKQIAETGAVLALTAYQDGDLEKALNFHQKVLEVYPSYKKSIVWSEHIALKLQNPQEVSAGPLPTEIVTDNTLSEITVPRNTAEQKLFSNRIPTQITLLPLEPGILGQEVYVNARVLGSDNIPLSEATLNLYIDDQRVRSGLTNNTGEVSIYAGKDLAVGTYRVKLVFNGTQKYLGAEIQESLLIKPIEITNDNSLLEEVIHIDPSPTKIVIDNTLPKITVPRNTAEQKSPSNRTPTQITLLPQEPSILGQEVYVNARVLVSSNMPLPEATLILYIDDKRVRGERTNNAGEVSIYAGKDLAVGTHSIKVVFNSNQKYLGTEAQGSLMIKPAEISNDDNALSEITVPRNTAEQKSPSNRTPTQITLLPQEPSILGQEVYVNARVLGSDNIPLSEATLTLYIDDKRVRSGRTNNTGEVSIYAGKDLAVGTYRVKLVFNSNKKYLGSETHGSLLIRPITLTVETIPPLANIGFALSGQEFFSDEQGIAKIEVTKLGLGAQHLQVLPLPEPEANSDTMIKFERWKNSFQQNFDITIERDMELQAGFALYHQVKLNFVDLEREQVPDSRISSFMLKNTLGNYTTLTTSGPHWFQANRVARLRNGLEATQVQHSLINLMVDGASVVNKFQQRFFVEPNDIWDIELLFYDVHIRAKDAFFGFPVGKTVDLIYPNDEKIELEFNKNKEIFVSNLARGIYRLQVNGMPGLAPVTPLALSKPQSIQLKVLSALDIGVALSAGLALALGLLLYGRPYIFKLYKARPKLGNNPVANANTANVVLTQSKNVYLTLTLDESIATGVHSEMLSAINTTRTQGITCKGIFLSRVPSVSWNKKLAKVAKAQVENILYRVNSGEINLATQAPPHLDSTGGRVSDRVYIHNYNFRKVGEVLASVSNGTAFIDGVIQGWQDSLSHSKVIMASNFEEVGIHFEDGVWAAVFGESISSTLNESIATGVHSEMLSAINTIRTQGIISKGTFLSSASSVFWNKKLAKAARTQVEDILYRVNSGEINLATQAPPHLDSTGGRVSDRVYIHNYNFRKVGEVLASVSNGTAFIDGVIQGWQDSLSHSKVIMASNFEEVGIHFEDGVWAAVFGEPRHQYMALDGS